MDELLTIEEVARYCKVHKATVRRHIASGRLRSVRVGRALRVRKEDLDQFVEPRSARATRERVFDVDALPWPYIDKEPRPFTLDDPLWDIVGMSNDPDNWWVSGDKKRALADAYMPKQ